MESSDTVWIAGQIRAALKEQGWTYKQLAGDLGLSVATLHRLRTGATKRVPHEVAKKLTLLSANSQATEPNQDRPFLSEAYSGLLGKHIKSELWDTIERLISITAKLEIVGLLEGSTPLTDNNGLTELPVDRLGRLFDESIADLLRRQQADVVEFDSVDKISEKKAS